MIWLYILAPSLLLITLTIGCCCFFLTCRRKEQVDILDEAAVKGTRYEDRFPKFLATHTMLTAAGMQDVYIKSHDGLKLHARWIEAENAKATVLIAHGYRSHPYIEFGDAIAFYRSMGVNLLLIDQRSHGKSQGKYITLGANEHRDVLSWLAYHNSHLAGCPVFLHGLSMGAATVMFTADQQLPHNLRGIIADCGFTSIHDILSHVFKKSTHLPAWPFIWVTDLCARLFAGFSIWEKDSRKTMRAPKVPVLLLHGTADNFVPCYMSRQIFDACLGDKTLLLVEGAAHAKCFPADPERCSKAIGAFIEKNLEVTGELRNYQKL